MCVCDYVCVRARIHFLFVCGEHLNRSKTSSVDSANFVQGSGGHSWSHHSTKTLQACCDMQSGRGLHVPALVIATGQAQNRTEDLLHGCRNLVPISFILFHRHGRGLSREPYTWTWSLSRCWFYMVLHGFSIPVILYIIPLRSTWR